MSILTLVALVMLSVAVVNGISIFSGKIEDVEKSRHRLSYIKSVGLFALVTGLLGQLIGLYTAFQYIEAAGSVSPAMLAGGLKVSSITSLYGMLIFIISYLVWVLLDVFLSRSQA